MVGSWLESSLTLSLLLLSLLARLHKAICDILNIFADAKAVMIFPDLC